MIDRRARQPYNASSTMSSPSIKVVLPLADAHTNRRTGGKAVCLSRLIASRFSVPKGFVISADAYRSHLWASGVREIASAQAEAEEREAIRAAILAQPIPEDIWQSVAEAYERLSWQIGDAEPKVAVRSSALEEGAGGGGFAGAYESYLNVSGLENLDAAIKRVWASLWSGKAAAYRARYGSPAEPAMGVIVQQMVEGDVCGSAFTANPVTGDPRAVDVIVREAEQSHQYSVSLHDFTITAAADADEGMASKHEALVKSVAEQAILVEDAAGGHVEIEWALDWGDLWIVQAAPIADLPVFFPAEPGDTVWTREDARAISGLGRSLLRQDAGVRIINGYLYRHAGKPERVDRDAAALMKEWTRNAPAVRDRVTRDDLTSLAIAVSDAGAAYEWMCRSERLAKASVEALAEVVQDRAMLHRLLGGTKDAVFERDALLQELGDRFSVAEKSGRLEEETWWRGYRADVERFARQYGYAFRDAGDAADPGRWRSWVEDADAVFRMIGAISRHGNRPTLVTLHGAAEQDAEIAEADMLGQLPASKRANVKQMLDSARSLLRLRSETEQLCALAGAALRQLVVRQGGILRDAGLVASDEEVFILRADELCSLVEQPAAAMREELPLKIAGRKHEGWLEQRLTPPRTLPVQEDTPEARPAAASFGTASGRARVVSTIEEAGDIDAGDILVVASPGSAWTPFLAVAGGLVCEHGHDFSPCAALARTYGIPAVVGMDGATDAIKDGVRITVNGTDGTINR